LSDDVRTNLFDLAANTDLEAQERARDAKDATDSADALLAEALSSRQPAERPRRTVDAHAAWQQLLAEFAVELSSNQLDASLQASQLLHYEDGHFIVGLPNAYYLDWVQERLRVQIKRKLASIMQRSSIDVSFRVTAPTPARSAQPVRPAPLYEAGDDAALASQPTVADARERAAVAASTTAAAPVRSRTRVIGPINNRFTFDSFVVGKHNRIAFAAAETIARDPGQRFNPLYIYGGVGLGKTHLLNAIGNQLAERGYTVLYCSTEQFTNDLVNAIRDRSTDLFRSKYREVDALLLDDIQFIVGKESTQEELFHTFNYLHAAGKQVIFTSDCPPRDLPRLEERLRSRFEGGLTTDIVAPDFETRVAILQTKVERQRIEVPYDVLMLVADRIKSNVRELEGALNNVWLHAKTHARPLDLTLAEAVLGSMAPRRSVCTPTRTVERVAAHFGLTPADLTGRRRTADVAHARQVAMYLLREENSLSLPAIGEHLGGRDHSTISHGVEKVTNDMQKSETLRQVITRLREQLYVP
jgi:chromosomal replication initiator protein